MKPLVFISHIHSQAETAIWLKEQITELLLGAVDFFVSSDGMSIVAGDRWLTNIEAAIQKASVVIVLCSKESIYRPWINFEAGGAWFLGKRVIPVCHGSLSPSLLPEPLQSIQGISLEDPKDFHHLIALLAAEAKLITPRFDANQIVATIPVNTKKAAGSVEVNSSFQLSRQTPNSLFEQLQSTVVRVYVNNRAHHGVGFLCTNNGLILTADFIVPENTKEAQIIFKDGVSITATVVNKDTQRRLALLQLSEHHDLPFLEVKVNDPDLFTDLTALGYQRHTGWTATSGRITGKRLTESGGAQLQVQMFTDSGFGGAPAVDQYGQFVGIIVMKAEADICFLTPSDVCVSFLQFATKVSSVNNE